jgi:hypothetical protein
MARARTLLRVWGCQRPRDYRLLRDPRSFYSYQYYSMSFARVRSRNHRYILITAMFRLTGIALLSLGSNFATLRFAPLKSAPTKMVGRTAVSDPCAGALASPRQYLKSVSVRLALLNLVSDAFEPRKLTFVKSASIKVARRMSARSIIAFCSLARLKTAPPAFAELKFVLSRLQSWKSVSISSASLSLQFCSWAPWSRALVQFEPRRSALSKFASLRSAPDRYTPRSFALCNSTFRKSILASVKRANRFLQIARGGGLRAITSRHLEYPVECV